jgi:hypothetical protein
MRGPLVLTGLFLGMGLCTAQKNDNTWIFGYPSSNLPAAGLDFYWGFADTVGFYPPLNFISSACAGICDDSGNLQFYTNGDLVGNWNMQLLQNSGNFNTDANCSYNDLWQSALIIPYPGHPDEYVIVHFCSVFYPSPTGNNALNPMKLMYSIVDMSLNNGLGEMTYKNQVAFSDTLMPCTLHAARHGNGRDWWIINKKANSNGVYVSLLTPAGILQNQLTYTGPSLSYFTLSQGQSQFSPDGSMYAIAFNTFNSVYLYYFDRCSGSVSFRDSVHIVPNDSLEAYVWACSFSPNSRFLYANTNNDLYQYDTWNANLAASKKYIAAFDGFADPFFNYFFRHAIGPDGKIYMTSWGSTRYLHIINDPDQPDTACNFVQHQLKLINKHASTLPEFPNYRLGALTGSPCDTITSAAGPWPSADIDFQVFPNPSKGIAKISYSLEPGQDGFLKITSFQGRLLLQKRLPPWSNQQALDLGRLADGIYLAAVSTGGRTAAAKLVLQR